MLMPDLDPEPVRLNVSVVVPVYAGEAFLDELAEALDAVRNGWETRQHPFSLVEVIFVNDGAIDDSATVLADLCERHSWMSCITLSKNFGQHAATVAGILHSSGDWVATLDEDLQHHPQFLETLLKHAVTNGRDIVYARPAEAVHQSLFRDVSSHSVKWLAQTLSGNPHVMKFNSFRMIRGPLARAAASVATERTYYDVALSWFSDRIDDVRLPLKDRRSIEHGASSYSWRSLSRHAWRLVLGSELKGLQVGTLAGFSALGLGVLGSCWVVLARLFLPGTIEVDGWSSLVIAVLFFGGLISSLMGISLQYLSILVLRALGRPTCYVVDRHHDSVAAAALTELEERESATPAESATRPEMLATDEHDLAA